MELRLKGKSMLEKNYVGEKLGIEDIQFREKLVNQSSPLRSCFCTRSLERSINNNR